jgi:hypothetical protein
MVPELPYRKQSQSSSLGDRLGARDELSHFASSFSPERKALTIRV